MKLQLAGKVLFNSTVNGEGLRNVIFAQGCKHNCKGCFNPHTHDICGGTQTTTDWIIHKAIDNQQDFIDGITLSGGDPFFQARAFCKIAEVCDTRKVNLWCYTGYTFEELYELMKTDKWIKYLLLRINVLVDGKFVEELKSDTCKYRGSTNQRLVDVKKTLRNKGVVVEYQLK